MGIQPRILVLSTRHVFPSIFRCFAYEFEESIIEIDKVDLLAPFIVPSNRLSKKLRLAKSSSYLMKYLANHTGIGFFADPTVSSIRINQDYDIFFTCIMPHLLYTLNSIKGWRERCRKAVCWIDEVWLEDILNNSKPELKLLSKFDHVFIGVQSCVAALENVIQRPCHYLPYGIDTVKFCPYPLNAVRCIDIYSIGRRSPIVHQQLLDFAKISGKFYIFDTSSDFAITNFIDFKEHRTLYADLAKRSKYFIANWPKADMGDRAPQYFRQELSSRFMEGASAGTVMIGEPSTGKLYQTNFGWPDAIINVPLDSTNVVDIITELDAQPERVDRIRKANVVNSLLRHDWVYRWEKILDTVGLGTMPELKSRKTRLQDIAAKI